MKRIAADVVFSVHDDGVVFLHASTGRLFMANRSGARIWRRLSDAATIDDIVADLGEARGIDAAAAREEAITFLAQLEDQHLISDGGTR
jgi:hypothetical protein